MERIKIAGTALSIVSATEALDLVRRAIRSRQAAHLVTANPEFLVAAALNPSFRRVLGQATGVLVDGSGLLVALRARGIAAHKTTGIDFIELLARLAAKERLSLYLLGAGPGMAQKTAQALKSRHPLLRIVGTYSGSPKKEDFKLIGANIAAAKPDILLVAFGSPAQDLWIAKTQRTLRVPVAMGVGGAFDFISGAIKRAPRWMQTLGLEWLWRLILQPRRIRRILNAVVVFPWLVLTRR